MEEKKTAYGYVCLARFTTHGNGAQKKEKKSPPMNKQKKSKFEKSRASHPKDMREIKKREETSKNSYRQ
jgi:hypothetical protein